MKLAGKVALVTGGARGIGRALALALAEAGADVAVNYERSTGDAEEVAAAIRAMDRRSIAVRADVSDAAAVRSAVATVLETWGTIDILVNNAGISRYTPFLEISEGEWDRVLDVDLKGQFLMGQEVARHMVDRRYGRIVNVASISASVAYQGLLHYQVAKAGVVMLTKSMALELAPYGITVNALAPGTVLTDLNRRHWSDPERRAKRLASIPIGRLGETQDLTAAVVYLASDDARWTTGAVLTVDGGQTSRTI